MTQADAHDFDVAVIGAGAAGMMCAIEAGKRGRRVLLLEKARKCGQKILISGGGRCNFTNLFAGPEKFISENPHFCKSALRQYTQTDFITVVEKHGIAYHEKKLGQLFCDDSSARIVDMLETECKEAGVTIWRECGAEVAKKQENGFLVFAGRQTIQLQSLVVATGGLSIPKLGANDIAYRIAKGFGLPLTNRRAGLVPFTFSPKDKKRFANLTGVSADVEIRLRKTSFRENLLFTHRGLSGPAILQISSFWEPGDSVMIDFLPDVDLGRLLKEKRRSQPKIQVSSLMKEFLPARLASKLMNEVSELPEVGNCSDKQIDDLVKVFKLVNIVPIGTEGYAKAEVTIGGVSTAALNSKTMEAKEVAGLFFIGEAVDVTGFLGGYNFQWAWSSGYVAGRYA
ncbi:NAD(P)/FAD-dependent oxidoreductase [uncultured Sneathiella sp.]|uniref:NAD(P)/FAD-dependent oxidoreductase n=1 Tax=uncultured Sneathiella sp. TaxID=879315 RepID=UPI0030EEA65D|tara:strand:- start:2189 stop:3382 length:1194 start_codon:yes stop_codon:yes gene_type:complete